MFLHLRVLLEMLRLPSIFEWRLVLKLHDFVMLVAWSCYSRSFPVQ